MSDVNCHHSSLNQPVNRSYAGFGHTVGFVKALAKRHGHKRELNHLLALPDYLLKDVGLTRGDILSALSEPSSCE
jgi:uncharacterized protein YjiS (DUF1127 family)